MGEKAMNVVSLVKEPNQELVKELRRTLADAEAGVIIGMVAVKLRPDSSFAIMRVGHCSDLELAGALAFAQHDLIAANSPRDES